MLERDGVAIAAAYGLFVLTLVYLGLFARVVLEVFGRILHWLAG